MSNPYGAAAYPTSDSGQMSTQSSQPKRVSRIDLHRRRLRMVQGKKRSRAARSVPTWRRGQNAQAEAPLEFLSQEECQELKAAGKGEWINRGRGFFRFDISTASYEDHDHSQNHSDNCGLDSRHINKQMLDAYVAKHPIAVAAVNGWA